MRSTLIAALVLAPTLLSAQALKAAQPQINESKLVAPNAPVTPADRGTLPAVRVSTGVVAPKLVRSVPVPTEITPRWMFAGKYRSAVVSLVVDKTGKPYDLKIVQSAGDDLDRNVLESVRHYRFEPATVSNQPIAMEVSLTVDVKNPRY